MMKRYCAAHDNFLASGDYAVINVLTRVPISKYLKIEVYYYLMRFGVNIEEVLPSFLGLKVFGPECLSHLFSADLHSELIRNIMLHRYVVANLMVF